MSLCPEVEAELMAHEAGELDVLRRARVDAHVAHCARCRGTAAALRRDLEAARAWDPSLEPAELERLARRVVVASPRAPAAARVVAAAALAATVAGVVWGLERHTPRADEAAVTALPSAVGAPSGGHAPAVEPVSGAMDLAIASRMEPPARAAQWAAGVRAVTSEDWTGRLSRRAGAVELEAVRGFAVITVDPGHPPLVLRAPDVVVEAREGRVFVEVLPGRPTRVQLLSGRADVVREGRREVLSASADDAPPRAPASDHARPTTRPAPRRSQPPPAEPVYPSTEALARVLEAEALLARGQRAEAERVLADGARRVEGERARALLRWEHARLVAQDPARLPEALSLLAALATRGHGEAAVQAAALRCQLMRADARPEACLDGLAPGSAALDEARRVLRRSQSVKEPSGS